MNDSVVSSQRQQIIDALSASETRAQARRSFIRSCSKREGLSTESKRSLQILSSFEAEHVRRSRMLRQIWMTLGTNEPLPPGLVSVSEISLRESVTLSTALEPWRRRSISDGRSECSEMWTLLSKHAASFIEASRAYAETSNSGSDS